MPPFVWWGFIFFISASPQETVTEQEKGLGSGRPLHANSSNVEHAAHRDNGVRGHKPVTLSRLHSYPVNFQRGR